MILNTSFCAHELTSVLILCAGLMPLMAGMPQATARNHGPRAPQSGRPPTVTGGPSTQNPASDLAVARWAGTVHVSIGVRVVMSSSAPSMQCSVLQHRNRFLDPQAGQDSEPSPRHWLPQDAGPEHQTCAIRVCQGGKLQDRELVEAYKIRQAG